MYSIHKILAVSCDLSVSTERIRAPTKNQQDAKTAESVYLYRFTFLDAR